MKRITEVSIVTICETQPDLSWIGEYTDKPSDWVIVREENDYLYNLEQAAKKAAYDYYVKECKKDGETPESIDNWSDGNWYYDLPERGREYRFFKPCAGGEKEGTEDYKTYGLQDFKRMEAYERQNWCMTGIKAVAKIQTSEDGKDWLCNEVSSGGLWGVESDCGADYKKEVADGQLAELRNALKAFGFNNRQIDQSFQNVKEIDGGWDN
jgi:hypothetical protein